MVIAYANENFKGREQYIARAVASHSLSWHSSNMSAPFLDGCECLTRTDHARLNILGYCVSLMISLYAG